MYNTEKTSKEEKGDNDNVKTHFLKITFGYTDLNSIKKRENSMKNTDQ